jgi:hypothetical protein
MNVSINKKEEWPSICRKARPFSSNTLVNSGEDEQIIHDNSSWELLAENDEVGLAETNPNTASNPFDSDIVIVSKEVDDVFILAENDNSEITTIDWSTRWQRIRADSMSSPDFRNLPSEVNPSIDMKEEIDNCSYSQTTTNDSMDTSSYAIINSTSSSNVSCWSMSSPLSNVTFRDVLLSKQRNDDVSDSGNPSVSPTTSVGVQNRVKIKSRFVVVSPQSTISRSFKSTGDIQALSRIPTDHESTVGFESQTSFSTDPVEMYHSHKLMGVKNRVNVLKLRPDELKRKTWIECKKNLQRQQAHVKSKYANKNDR